VLFRKDIPPACAYCGKGNSIGDGEVLCRRHGIVRLWDSCRVFRYDPYRRIPENEPRLKRVIIETN
jgi:hypothetical protein